VRISAEKRALFSESGGNRRGEEINNLHFSSKAVGTIK
jgi:hypothetical protein